MATAGHAPVNRTPKRTNFQPVVNSSVPCELSPDPQICNGKIKGLNYLGFSPSNALDIQNVPYFLDF